MKHLLDIPDLNARAFLPVAGRMRLYGKSDPPPAPDYVGQANATAAGNLDAARAQTTANRMDQVTPYGTIKYTNGQTFDQAGYDAAVKDYETQLSAYNNAVAQRAGNPMYVPNPFGSSSNDTGNADMVLGNYGPDPVAPGAVDRNAFLRGNPDKWSSEIILSDTGRQLLDQSNRTQLGLGALQDTAMDRVRDAQATPFDTSGLIDINGSTGMDAWDRAADLVRQRQNPELDRQQSALDTKLANMGLTAGSEGWGIQQGQFGKQRNDAEITAQMAGLTAQNQFFNQGVAGNQATLQQRAFLRQLPLNELNALRTGAQVTNPTFTGAGQQGQTQGADLLGATGSQYQAQLGQVNSQNAQAAGTTSAAIGAAGMAAMAFF